MRLLVIGSTGCTGRHVLEQGVERGHEITAFARRPDQLADFEGLERIIHGDGLVLDDVQEALKESRAEAVIFAGGNSGVICNVITAMNEAGVKRLIVTSSRSIVATRPRFVVALVWVIFREQYADLARTEGMLQASELDWSIVRAVMLDDRPGTGEVHTDFEANATGGDWKLSRVDYATALLDVAEDPEMVRKAVGVGGVKQTRTKSRT